MAEVAAERDRLADELASALEHARQVSKIAATEGARLKQFQESNDRLRRSRSHVNGPRG